MTHRFLIYPLLFITLLQFFALLRNEPRWNLGQIVLRLLILLTSGLAMLDNRSLVWVIVAWGMFGLFVGAPGWAARRALRWLMAGEMTQAASAWRRTAWLIWGRQRHLYREYAAALEIWSAGREAAAEARLQQLDAANLPAVVRGEVRLWRLWLLTCNRHWQRAVDYYESIDAWGTLGSAMQARLAVARAYAELGLVERAMRCLLFVTLSPRTVGALEQQLWLARISVMALAGDGEELEKLLGEKVTHRQRGFAWFAAVWRGRCALVRGDREEAGRQLSRSLALTPVSLPKWREAIAGYLQQAEHVTDNLPEPPVSDVYRHMRDLLHHAEGQTRDWRSLMQLGQPKGMTRGLLALLVAVFVVDEAVSRIVWQVPLWEWFGNLPVAQLDGEWWRPVTALLLHANLLHLVMNAVALWVFGSAIEKMMGWARMLTIFLVAGTLANIVSAFAGGFDVSVGASGGIFGLVAAFGVAVFRLRSPIYAAVRRRLLQMLTLMLAADLTIGGLEAQIDNFAHVGGFVVGLIITVLLVPDRSTVERTA